jgi:transcriptional regulator with XRE-family HTH domain
MGVSERIKELRTAKKLTQSDLAKLVGLTYIQIGRYETGKSAPSADVLNKLAEALGTTNDFLMNGSGNDMISAQLTDKELLSQFKEVEKLNQEDKHLIKTFIDAFLTKRHIQKLANT